MFNLFVSSSKNETERDTRMMKLQQEISGGLGSNEGADCFCRVRGVISMVKRNEMPLFTSLLKVLKGDPLSLLPLKGLAEQLYKLFLFQKQIISISETKESFTEDIRGGKSVSHASRTLQIRRPCANDEIYLGAKKRERPVCRERHGCLNTSRLTIP